MVDTSQPTRSPTAAGPILRRGAATVVLAVALVLAVATPASAHTGSHGWPTDGCTAVPDLWFNHACVHHDGCYAYHWADRATCDAWFRNDMLAACAARLLPNLIATCAGTAMIYYGGVRVFGQRYYDSPRIATRIGTPMA